MCVRTCVSVCLYAFACVCVCVCVCVCACLIHLFLALWQNLASFWALAALASVPFASAGLG